MIKSEAERLAKEHAEVGEEIIELSKAIRTIMNVIRNKAYTLDGLDSDITRLLQENLGGVDEGGVLKIVVDVKKLRKEVVKSTKDLPIGR